MDKIDLDTRDRRNLYREDVNNVFVLAMSADEGAVDAVADVVEGLSDAVEHLQQTGQRFAYVVIRIER